MLKPHVIKDCSMIKEKYTNIINMFEKSKKIEEDVKMKRSSKKRPIVKIKKNKENNEDEIKLESLTKLINHSNSLKINLTQKRRKSIIHNAPLLKINNIYDHIDEFDHSFLEEDEHEFMSNLPNAIRKFTNTDDVSEKIVHFNQDFIKNSNKLQVKKYTNDTLVIISKNIDFQTNSQINLKLSNETNFAIEPKKSHVPSNDHSVISDNEAKNHTPRNKYFSFYSKEHSSPLNNLVKNTSILETNNHLKQESCIKIEKPYETESTKPTKLSNEILITTPIEMQFPAVNPNNNVFLKISKTVMPSDEKINYNSNINININTNAPFTSNQPVYNANEDILSSLNININKKERKLYLNKYKTINSSSDSKSKINNYLTNGSLRNISINASEANNDYNSERKIDKELSNKYLNENCNLKTIESVPESVKTHGNQPDEYHNYVVVRTQSKYGNKNINLARKSQITNPKEILYNT